MLKNNVIFDHEMVVTMQNLTRGILLSVEGIDGSGKSTLANRLKDALLKKNISVQLTYEPGDSELGKQLRELLQRKPVPMCDKSEYLLYAADRAQHFEQMIIPTLKEKKMIISDRMHDSSLAYQGYGRGLDIDLIKKINNWAMQGVKPDLTLYIQIPLKIALERLKKRKGRPTSIEQEKETFTKKVINGFDTIFANNANVLTLDGQQDQEMLAKTALANVMRFLKDKKILQP